MPNRKNNSSRLKELRLKRNYIINQVDRIREYLDREDKTIIHVKLRQPKLEKCWSDFHEIQPEIETLAPEELDSSTVTEFEDTYYYIEEQIHSFINSSEDETDVPKPPKNLSCRNHEPTLPPIKIEPFSGKYDDWLPFRDMWVSLIHNRPDISNVEKLQRLKSLLKGEASSCLQNLPSTNENYPVAWSILQGRFENQRLIISRHLQALFDIPKSDKESAKELRIITDNATSQLEALKALNLPTDSWDAIIIHLITTTKLDPTTVRAWEATLNSDSLPTFSELHKFLLHRCQVLEALENNKTTASSSSSGKSSRPANANPSYIKTRQSNYHPPSNSRSFPAVNSQSVSRHVPANRCQVTCPLCKLSHPIYFCEKLRSLPLVARWETVKRLNLCTNCLRSHKTQDCRSSRCKTCNSPHNSLLCKRVSLQNTTTAVDNQRGLTEPPNATSASVSYTTAQTSLPPSNMPYDPSTVLLSTVLIKIKNAHNGFEIARALLDSGSQANFVTLSLCQRLGIKPEFTLSEVSGIGQMTHQTSQTANLEISSRVYDFHRHLSFFVLPSITQRFPAFDLHTNDIKIPHSVQLADPTFCIPGDIDLLLGAEVFYEALRVGHIRLTNQRNVLQETAFGWIVTGRASNKNITNQTFCHLNTITTNDLETQIKRFWELEEASLSNDLTPEERQCEDHFRDTFKRDETGRFVVKLPFKDTLNKLGESRTAAVRRYQNVIRKLETRELDKSRYHNFMSEYLKLGHMMPVLDKSDSRTQINYLPHHAVFKETSSTTKLRVVFDASCKTSTGYSLNDILMAGPTIQQDIFSIQARLRTHKYVLMADIEKMYRQIKIDPNQTNLHRIIWHDESQRNIQEFSLQTLTYGTKPASFLATRCLQQLAMDAADIFPLASAITLRDYYMDDLQTGCNSIKEGLQIQSQMITMLRSAGMELRKWASNSSELLEYIPHEHREATNINYDFSYDSTVKALGLCWSPLEDTYKYSLSLNPQASYSKRTVISDIARIFDPLGLIAPIVVKAKIFLQKTWTLKVSWDDSLPKHFQDSWNKFRDQLCCINELVIPRYLIPNYPYANLELHGFSDSSQDAYGACLYLVSTGYDGSITSNLICSKSRVAPLKTVSIPRLELCGSLLLAELFEKTSKILNLPISSYTLWTDSAIVLSWLRTSKRLKVFVGNRVAAIQNLTNVDCWRHVATHENPADCLSRGATVSELARFSLWWHGPTWLSSTESNGQWPAQANSIEDQDLPELRDEVIALPSLVPTISQYFKLYSSFTKFIRIFCFVFRFIKNIQGKNVNHCSGPITPKEFNNTLMFWVKRAQEEMFHSEMINIKGKTPINKKSPLLRLHPYLDEKGLLRVGGRLDQSAIPFDRKHPILLPARHPFTKMIMSYEHVKNLHAGPQATLAAVQSRFWPLRGRNLARLVYHECVTCFKNRPNEANQLMASLPKHRVEVTRPFAHTGVDYGGPFKIRNGGRRSKVVSKAYAAIFVCFSTKAVHIELVSDLTSASFIAALKRFTGRRGQCLHLYSDNATTFKGAQHELGDLRELFLSDNHKKIRDSFLLDSNSVWINIAPKSPHHGGLWESAVKSMKFHLKRVVGDRILNFEELNTVLVQIECCLNSRPLTYQSSDPSDPRPLTPGHFLTGDALNSYLEPDLRSVKQTLLSRWQLTQQILQHFWSRWSKEYLSSLQARTKWNSTSPNLKVGTVALVKEDNLPPLKWSMAVIHELHPGSDGLVRVVTIKTPSGFKKRPIVKLCPLPFNDEH